MKCKFLWLAVILTVFISVSGCSSSLQSNPLDRKPEPAVAIYPEGITGPPVESLQIQSGQSEVVNLSNGAKIVVSNLSEALVFGVEGTFTEETFVRLRHLYSGMPEADRKKLMREEISKVFSEIREAKAAVIPLIQSEDLGYFSFLLRYQPDLFTDISKIRFQNHIIINPVVYDPEAVRSAKAFTSRTLGLNRGTTQNYTGLESIGVSEFLKLAEADLGTGVRVNGSSVRLGVTDTGVTYNHPAFLSDQTNKNRISYMKDFTGEGAVYFSSAAKFSAQASSTNAEEVTINAEVLMTPDLPSVPVGDSFSKVENLKIKVSAELKARLLDPASAAKLGILNEDNFQSGGDKVDLNANGKMDDKFYVILIPGSDSVKDVIYFDATATGDFRNAKPVSDWNSSRSTVDIFAEKVGFHIQKATLPSKNAESTVEVTSAAIVGFDPGNHGTHVSGIAAGRRIIQNDNSPQAARGVAPEASILVNRVCSNNNGCVATAAFIDLVTEAGAEVVNMSLGGLSPFNDGNGVQETVINRLTDLHNVLFVVSAGNSGPGRQTVGAPSTARMSLSVGASASRSMVERQYQWPASGEPDQDFVLFFSSRGPTAAGGFKPNVTAPGTQLSAIQLNSAPGARGGLEVMWGTSMAAPTATGAYALLLDAVKKYNAKNPTKQLTTDSIKLRQVLIDTARPYDVSRLDVASGGKSEGQYTWIDQGTGMIHLPSAWKKLFELRDQEVPASVQNEGTGVELDYQILVSTKGPNGIPYDGSRKNSQGTPAFGTGLFLDYHAEDSFRQVGIARRLSLKDATGAQAGELNRQLLTTRDEFVLKTVVFGSDKIWVKAGVRNELNCWQSESANLSVLGRGAEIEVDDEGKARLNPMEASALNLCFNRSVIGRELSPGDHGALIYGYRLVEGKVSPLASFIVPVYVTVPHKTLSGKTAYEIERAVKSFGVDRNYVNIPKGTSMVRVTLEIPPMKMGENGVPAEGEHCSGVELMSYEGVNNAKSIERRADARISNCNSDGAPGPEGKRTLTFYRMDPTVGMWDIDVFGTYRFPVSKYKLRVDFVAASSSVTKVEGKLSALNGNMTWTLKDASIEVSPDAGQSTIELDGLLSKTEAEVSHKKGVIVPGPNGAMRSYPTGTQIVTITIGGSPGNDLDLQLLQCSDGAKDVTDPSCIVLTSSRGATDEEKVIFGAQPGKLYAVRVMGFDVKDDGTFTSTEKLSMGPDRGSVSISGSAPAFRVGYSFTIDTLLSGNIVRSELFTTGKYRAVGHLTLRSTDQTVLTSIPVEISK